MIDKTLNIMVDENPARISFAHDITNVSSIRMIYFRLSGIDMSAVPTHLFMKIDEDNNVRPSVSVNSNNLSVGNNYVRATSAMIPLHFELASKYNDGVDPDAQYAVLFGVQPEEMAWRGEDIDTLKSFRISLIRVDGTDYVMPSGAILQYVFTLKYKTATNRVVKATWGK